MEGAERARRAYKCLLTAKASFWRLSWVMGVPFSAARSRKRSYRGSAKNLMVLSDSHAFFQHTILRGFDRIVVVVRGFRRTPFLGKNTNVCFRGAIGIWILGSYLRTRLKSRVGFL